MKILTFAAMTGCLAGISELHAQVKGGQPNVLFIIADDLRPELGCYGAPQVLTPNIDRLAGEGVLFSHAYCNIPVSGASRASLLTGLYPRYPDRFTSFDAWAERDAPEAVPISGWFGEHGYTTLSAGKVFHNFEDHRDSWSGGAWRNHPEGYGSDWAEYNKWELWLNDSSGEYVNPRTKRGPFCEMADVADSLYQDGRLARKAADELGRLAHDGKPFFMAVGFWRPHLPFNAPKKYWDMYQRSDIEIADNRFRPEGLPRQVTGSGEIRGYARTGDSRSDDFHREARHGYMACVSFIDAQVGLLLDRLDELGLRQNTIVVLIGDHGWHLGEHEFWGKHNLMNLSTRAPFIVSIPGVEPRVADGIAEFVDIFPTLCDAAGIPFPEGLDGASQMPVIKGENRRVKEYATIVWGNGVCMVDDRFNYACWPADDRNPAAEMLFDHRNDYDENTNAASKPKYKRAVGKFRGLTRTSR